MLPLKNHVALVVAGVCWGVCCQAQVLQDDAKSCRLLTLLPFTDQRSGIPFPHNNSEVPYLNYGYGVWPNQETLSKASFSLMASAEMARRHFNDRNPVIVPELADDTLKECDVQIPENSMYLDSAYSRTSVVDQLMGEWERTIQANETDFLCGIIGPIEARANEGASTLAEMYGIPQLAYATIDRRLSRSQDFPNFRRIIPRGEDYAATIAEYIQRDIWKRDYIGIVYDQSDYGELFEDPLEDAEDPLEFESMTEHLIEGTNESIHDSLGDAVSRGYRTIILITDRPSFLDDIALVAEDKNMLDGDYFWVVSGDAFPPALSPHLRYEVGSPADKLLRGAALFTNYDRFVYEGETNKFLQEWRKQPASLVEDLNTMQPHDQHGNPHYLADVTYFQDETPTEYSSFIYDAIITAGISACKAKNDMENDHMHHVLRTQLNGASGPLAFYDKDKGEYETSRNAEGVLFGMYNVRPGPVDENNMRGYQKVLTSLYSQDYTYEYQRSDGQVLAGKGAWKNVEGTEFLFHDGTPQEPLPKIAVFNPHYLSRGIQVLGFTLAAFALLISFGSALWVYCCREKRLIKASQPEFIYALCGGALLVSSSVFFVSFDEDKGVSTGRLSRMCETFPWFFVLGYLIMYCALFSKLWRLSKLMQMRRRVVNIKQVLLPFSLIIACSILILILWQVIDPLTWEVTVISEEPRETYGECRSQHILFYLVALFTLFAAIMLMTAVVSWKMKDVQSDLSESRWIFFGIFLHIQIWAIGLPVIYIVDEVSKDAEYLMYAALTFVFSTSLVVLVVWPKIYVWVRDTYFGGPGRTTRVNVADPRSTRVSGLTTPSTRERLASSTNSNVGSQRQVNRIEQLEREVDSLKRKLREHSYSGPPEQSLPASPEKAEPPAVDQNASDTNVKQQTSASLDSSSPVSLEIGERTEL